jgi:hypothetical protein
MNQQALKEVNEIREKVSEIKVLSDELDEIIGRLFQVNSDKQTSEADVAICSQISGVLSLSE